MKAVIFSGPSLSPEEAHGLFPEAVCLGPAARGDVLRAVQAGAQLICLIDGVFEHQPSVNHKELLWALSRGVTLWGASSMGALRAVELAPYGMKGSGSVYAAFARGELEDDDEVAVAHAGAEHQFRSTSDALVNLRATFAAAVRDGVIEQALEAELLRIAKATFYAERLLNTIAARAPAAARDALLRWLAVPGNRRDAKRTDACELLHQVCLDVSQKNPAQAEAACDAAPAGAFPRTSAWEYLVSEVHEATRCASSLMR